MLDIIGKSLYTRRNQANLARNIRNNNPSTDNFIASLKFEPKNPIDGDAENTKPESESGSETIISSAFGEVNRKAIASILLASSGILTPSKYGDKIKIQIRCYYNSNKGQDQVNSKLEEFANNVKKALLNPETLFIGQDGKFPVADKAAPKVNPDDVNVIAVDLAKQDGDEVLSPSSRAWEIARSMVANSAKSGILTDVSMSDYSSKLNYYLINNVIDVWASATPNTDTGEETSNSKEPQNNEAYIKEREKFIADQNKALGF